MLSVELINKDAVCDLLFNYASNGIPSSDIAEKFGLENNLSIAQILGDFQKNWDNAPCDSEGANAEQDKYLDDLIDNAADSLISLIAA